jgi:hypothetical protein
MEKGGGGTGKRLIQPGFEKEQEEEEGEEEKEEHVEEGRRGRKSMRMSQLHRLTCTVAVNHAPLLVPKANLTRMVDPTGGRSAMVCFILSASLE